MRANKHLLLWSSVGAFLLLAAASLQEGYLQEWQRSQRGYRSELDLDRQSAFDMQLRQIVIPSLSATDRCVSCHVGMTPGEEGMSGDSLFRPHPDLPHSPADFGCVVCHGGQGRATKAADAHGTVSHWPNPMLPQEYVYAGCGSCHTHLAVSNLEIIERGERLLERYDCLACHTVEGRGGTVRPGLEEEIPAVDLSIAGAAGWDEAWHANHLKKHDEARDGLWLHSYGPLSMEEVEAIDVYLSTLVGAPGLVKAKALFHSLGCRGCHKVGGVGGDDGPDLTQGGQRDPGQLDFGRVAGDPTVANWLREHLRFPARIVPDSLMPYLGLSSDEIEQLTYYTLSLRRSEVPEAHWPRDRILAERFDEREFAADGPTLYGTFCGACHGPEGEGMRYAQMSAFPAVGNRDFLETASDRFIIENIRRGRPGRRMPSWGSMDGGLRPDEIEAVAVYVRMLEDHAAPPIEQVPDRWIAGDSDSGSLLYEKSCSGCHGPEGEGLEGPALSNPVFLEIVSDTYLIETIRRGRRDTSMKSFDNPSPIQPSLTRSEIEDIGAFIRNWEQQ
jgi:mono/diheme cytochrome c family protein